MGGERVGPVEQRDRVEQQPIDVRREGARVLDRELEPAGVGVDALPDEEQERGRRPVQRMRLQHEAGVALRVRRLTPQQLSRPFTTR